MSEYTKLNERVWSEFGRRLLSEDDELLDKQLEFLEACRQGKEAFLQYLNDYLFQEESSIIDGKGIKFKYVFTEAEFYSLPDDIPSIVWKKFKDIPIEEKMSCGFWGYIIIQLIKTDSIKPYYLASKSSGDGLFLLDKAIKKQNTKIVDDCVRKVLRSMANKAPRGSRVLFDDFNLGKAYWNHHWAYHVKNLIGLDMEGTLGVFSGMGGYSRLSEKMFSGKSYISQENILGGLILFLKDNPVKAKRLSRIIDKISYISIWKAIEAQSPKQNRKEIEDIDKKISLS